MGADEMRRSGYAVVDWLVERLAERERGPVLRCGEPQDLRRRLAGRAPDRAAPLEDLLSTLAEDVIPFAAAWSHPRFFGYIPGSGTWPAALADFIVSAINLDASTWREAAGLTRLEQLVVEWMNDWLGYPRHAEGLLLSGGSAANMTALACARHASMAEMDSTAVLYVSDQAHSSLARAARVLGFRSDQVRVLASDDDFVMNPALLDRALTSDVGRGLVPVMVAAAAGSTNTGAVDPLVELAEVCRAHGTWLHVDAAYGGFAILTDRGRRLLEGIDRADSITVDPHKWLYQPFECGGLLVRRPGALADAFRITPPYLEDADGDTETNFSNLGLQLSRSSRAVKVWMSVSNLGLDAFRGAIDESMRLARKLEQRITEDDRFELLTPAHLSVVCFRRTWPNLTEARLEALNAGLVAALAESGIGLVSSTRLAGRYAIRMCVFNHSTTADDVNRVVDWLAVTEPIAESESWHAPRNQLARVGWFDPDIEAGIRGHPLLTGVDAAIVDRLLASGQETVVPGQWVVVEELATTNEFYLVLDGEVAVTSTEQAMARLGPGTFFGEMAALDWGAGFGSPRMATVTTVTETRLFTVPATVLNRAMRTSPALRRAVESVAAERARDLRRAVHGGDGPVAADAWPGVDRRTIVDAGPGRDEAPRPDTA